MTLAGFGAIGSVELINRMVNLLDLSLINLIL